MSSMSQPLAGRVVMITGGAERVGRVFSLALARVGASVVINHWRTAAAAESTAAEIRALGSECLIVEGDISDVPFTQHLVDVAVAKFGRLDVLVHNASNFFATPFLEVTEADFERSMGVNLKGPFFLSQAAARVMVKQGSGRILAMVGESYYESWPDYAAHCVAKVGLAKLMKVLAVTLSPVVQCNAICPASILPPDDRADLTLAAQRGEVWISGDGSSSSEAPATDLSRLVQGTPDNVAELVVYLATCSNYLTGSVLTIDGGKSAI